MKTMYSSETMLQNCSSESPSVPKYEGTSHRRAWVTPNGGLTYLGDRIRQAPVRGREQVATAEQTERDGDEIARQIADGRELCMEEALAKHLATRG